MYFWNTTVKNTEHQSLTMFPNVQVKESSRLQRRICYHRCFSGLYLSSIIAITLLQSLTLRKPLWSYDVKFLFDKKSPYRIHKSFSLHVKEFKERKGNLKLRDSPRSQGGLSPSRSRSVWPSYPRTHLASPRRPATPRLESHSETTSISSPSWQSDAVTCVCVMNEWDQYRACLYLQHEHHSLHDVPLRLTSVHDDGEAPSLTLLTERDKEEAFYITRTSFKLWTPTFTYSFLFMLHFTAVRPHTHVPSASDWNYEFPDQR